MCRHLARSLNCLVSPSPSAAPAENVSKKCYCRKLRACTRPTTPPLVTAASAHEYRIDNCVLLDRFVFLQRNRKRLAWDRSRGLTAQCEEKSSGCAQAQPVAQKTGTPARDRTPGHECR